MIEHLDIAEGLSLSSTHSIRRPNHDVARHVGSRLPSGTPPLKGTRRLTQRRKRAEAVLEAFIASLPPRDIAFEEREVCSHIARLDSSAPRFVRSRTLDSDGLENDLPSNSRLGTLPPGGTSARPVPHIKSPLFCDLLVEIGIYAPST
jgi:hypothetical protein